MINLAEMFAKCGNINNHEVLRLFNDELDKAHHFQGLLGYKAQFHHVIFEAPTSAASAAI
jgi:hypothetical protein